MATTREEIVANLIMYAADDYRDEQYPLMESFVDDAIEEVRNVRYPFGWVGTKDKESQEAEVIARYHGVIRRIDQYHYDKIGKNGVTTFYEAGQTTSWESGGTPKSYFNGIIPVAKLV